MKIEKHDDRQSTYCILCVLASAVALFPLGCDYVMDGGIVTEWLARVAEVAEGFRSGEFYLFPSLETRMASGLTENVMNSNLWFIFPGFLYFLTGKMVLAYRVYMLLVQIGTFLAAFLCFKRIFMERMGMSACIGIVLYMTNPYRIYVCYDIANLSQATAWMLIPLYIWAIYGLFASRGRLWEFAIAALALAGIGYADIIILLTATGITLLAGIAARKPFPCMAAATGCLLAFPGMLRLESYLFTDEFAQWEIPLQMIMQKGYHVGQFFSSYAFRDGKPGMGLGMMICLLAVLWLRFVNGEKQADKKRRSFIYIALFLAVLSLFCFPWDILQRLGDWSVKLISLIETPAVFWGMATAVFCIPAADSMERVSRCENKLAASLIPAAVILFCVGICVYHCNMLTYSRLPMNIGF
ncbi:glycosyltransferase family protein [Acetatifactor aquisgranensis]|uniref:hypothetical protein n=1 Tax=Acetatifactor aquisgranensis TaxID=2941233 RepID=UPI00203FED94|nr:hypothetical protein [Acetatifactor aquisgranensis]